MKRIVAASALFLCGATLHCAELPTVNANACGNGVLEVGEACDPLVDGSVPACRPPGDPFACRIDCTATACPVGYGCDVGAKICRAALGTFREQGTLASEGALFARLADLDGDGRTDVVTQTSSTSLLATSRLALHYFDAAGTLKTSLPIARPGVTPSIVQIDPARRGSAGPMADIVLGATGVAMLRGNAERVIDPALLPSFALPSGQPFDAFPIFAPAGRVAANPLVDLSTQVRVVQDRNDLRIVPLDGLGNGPGYPSIPNAQLQDVLLVTGTPRAPLQFGARPAPCGYVLAGAKGASSLQVFSPECDAKVAAAEVPPPVQITLTAGAALCPGILPSQVQTLPPAAVTYDRVFALQDKSILFVKSLADRIAFWASTASSTGFAAPCRAADSPPTLNAQAFLELADFNVDGTDDFVLSSGVLLRSRDAGSPTVIAAIAPNPWTVAITGDFNGDSFLDVAAASGTAVGGSAGLDVLLGDGTGRFVNAEVSPLGAITHLTSGDFNADGIDDIVLADRIDTQGTSQVKAFLGSRAGRFLDARSLGQVKNLRALRPLGTGSASVLVTPSAVLLPPSTPKLGIVGQDYEAVALGGPDNLLLAPLLPRREGEPLLIASGHLDAEAPEEQTVVAVFNRTQPRIWTTRSSDRVFRSSLTQNASLANGLVGLVAGATRKVPFLTTGLEEMLVVVSLPGRDTVLGALRSIPKDFTPTVLGSVPGVATADTHLKVFDGNGDGVQDVVLERPTASDPQAYILWGDAKSGALSAPTLLADVRSVAPSKAGLVGIRSTGQLVRIRLEAGATKIEPLLAEGGDLSGRPTSLGIGDINGDGIEDLVLVDQGALRIFRGEEKTP